MRETPADPSAPAADPAAGWSTSAGRRLASSEPAPAPTAPPAPPTRRRRAHLPAMTAAGDTTRVTVDVPRDDHRGLRATADAVREALPGTPHVPIGHVMVALAHLINDNDELRARVTEYLRERVEQ